MISSGSRDIIVGVSGFGSAWMGGERFQRLSDITGWSLYTLRYSSQILPRIETGPLEYLSRLYARFRAAEIASERAAAYLSKWVDRWSDQGRRVLLVGFSLGGHVVYEAARASPNCSVMTLCAGHPADPDSLSGLEKTHGICHLYSPEDLVLKTLYQMATQKKAAGQGPLPSWIPAMNVDVSDHCGGDHVKASEMASNLFEIGLECLLGSNVHLFGGAPTGGPRGRSLSPRIRATLRGSMPQDLLWQRWAEAGCDGVCQKARGWVPPAARWSMDRRRELSDLSMEYQALKREASNPRGILSTLGRGRLWAIRDGVDPAGLRSFSSSSSASRSSASSSGQASSLEPSVSRHTLGVGLERGRLEDSEGQHDSAE